MRLLIAVAAFTLACLPAHAGDWAEKLAAARSIYFVPLDTSAYAATLELPGASLSVPGEKFSETLADGALFAEFNAATLAALKTKFGEKARLVPDSFRVEKKVLFAKVQTYDWEAMDCDFYALAQIEKPGTPRGAHYRLSSFDAKERGAYISLMPAPVSLTLYHKPKPDHEGKKVVRGEAELLGPHKFQMVSGKSVAEVIEETVAAELEGREPQYPVETYHFAWAAKHYAGRPDAVRAGFARHAGRLRARLRERLFSALADFTRALDKKLR